MKSWLYNVGQRANPDTVIFLSVINITAVYKLKVSNDKWSDGYQLKIYKIFIMLLKFVSAHLATNKPS